MDDRPRRGAASCRSFYFKGWTFSYSRIALFIDGRYLHNVLKGHQKTKN